MPTIINPKEFYDAYGKKLVDSCFKRYSYINNSDSESYRERFIELLELKKNNPFSSGSEYFKILYGNKYETDYKKSKKNPFTPYLISYWKKRGFSEEEAVEKIKEYKAKKATNLENFIKKYGEEKGKTKYNEYTEKSKHTEEKFRKKYGDCYKEKWDEYKRSKDSMSLEWALYKCNGDLEKAIILCQKRANSVKLELEKKSKELGSFEKALDFIKNVNKSKTVDFEYYLKKNNGSFIDATKEYGDLLKKRRVNFGDASKISLFYFLPIYNYLNENTNDKVFLEIPESKPFFLYDKVNKKSYCYDFCIIGYNKIIIEFNGIKWHPRLDKYKMDESSKILIYDKTEERIKNKYKYDLQKEKLAVDNGYKYLIVWDDDDPSHNIEKIEKFLNANKINFNYNENDKNQIHKKAKPRKVDLGS